MYDHVRFTKRNGKFKMSKVPQNKFVQYSVAPNLCQDQNVSCKYLMCHKRWRGIKRRAEFSSKNRVLFAQSPGAEHIQWGNLGGPGGKSEKEKLSHTRSLLYTRPHSGQVTGPVLADTFSAALKHKILHERNTGLSGISVFVGLQEM